LLRADANRRRSYDDRDGVPNDPAKNLTKGFGGRAACGHEADGAPIFTLPGQEISGLSRRSKWTPVAKDNMLTLGVWGKRL
jgi:hypothetical protein